MTDAPSVAIDLPTAWDAIPVEPEAYAEWLRDADLLRDLPADDARRVEAALRSVLVEARQEGLVLAAAFAQRADSRDADGEPVADPELLTASAFVAVRPAGPAEGALSSVAWLTALRQAELNGDLLALRPPEVVMLGAREAVKSVALEDLPADQNLPDLPLLGVTYYLTVDDGAAVLVLGFRTPCVWFAADFEVLFDDIAATLDIAV